MSEVIHVSLKGTLYKTKVGDVNSSLVFCQSFTTALKALIIT